MKITASLRAGRTWNYSLARRKISGSFAAGRQGAGEMIVNATTKRPVVLNLELNSSAPARYQGCGGDEMTESGRRNS